jgi:hypothetical protein
MCCELGEDVDVADGAELPSELLAGEGALPRVIEVRGEVGGEVRGDSRSLHCAALPLRP